jgi:wyosine [tRNA(Phe)-imidazoG37] synthetase (radical SAM superfamily)
MCGDWGEINKCESSHGIIYEKCNFNCVFCNNRFNSSKQYHEYEEDEFIATILHLLNTCNRFKFSGGEPTLNPYLEQDLSIVKQLGGYVFVDSNGSKPQLMKRLIEQNLIDVLGISLKGLSKEQAKTVAGIKNTTLSWDNVLSTIDFASKKTNIRVIITYVFYNGSDMYDINKYASLIANYPNVFLKVNNLLHKKHHQDGLQPIDSSLFVSNMHCFFFFFSQWKGRVIVVNTEEAISRFEKIIFL